MPTAKVFKSGNSQAVRLPKEFRFATEEVEIFRRGDEVVLREKPENLLRAVELIQALPEDVFEALAEFRNDPPQEREGL